MEDKNFMDQNVGYVHRNVHGMYIGMYMENENEKCAWKMYMKNVHGKCTQKMYMDNVHGK